MIEEQEQTSSTPPISGSLLHKTFSTVERLQAYQFIFLKINIF